MWFKRDKSKRNRRLGRSQLLNVKLRSDQVRATRVRTASLALAVVFGTFLSLYLVWKISAAVLNAFVYENADFAIRQVDVNTDGVIAPDQLRRWAGVKPGANLVGLDLAMVKRNLELVPAIETVSVERALPHTLKIRVTERTPIAQAALRGDAADGNAILVVHLDVNGVVMQPLDPRVCSVSVQQRNAALPFITGANVLGAKLGGRVEQPQLQAALRLIAAFGTSPMAGLADLRRVDVSPPGVVIVTTGQGSQITFALENMEHQLARWYAAYDRGLREGRGIIKTADFAVAQNTPTTWMKPVAVPQPAQKPPVKPVKPRRTTNV